MEADISLTNEQRSQRHDFFVHLRYYIPSIYMHYFLFHQHLSLQTIDSYHQIHQNLTDSCHQSLLPFHINDKRHELIWGKCWEKGPNRRLNENSFFTINGWIFN